jgi:hypothetical protein
MQAAGPLEAHPAAEPILDLRAEGRRACGEKLGPVIDRHSVPTPRGSAAAEASAFFQNKDVLSGGAQMLCGCQAGDPGTHDEHIASGHIR